MDQQQMNVATPPALPPVHEAWLPREHSLHRPRHGRRQPTALISAMVFFCTPLLLLVIGVRPEAIENRRLTDFPSLAAGWQFFSGLSPWATDHLPLRQQAIDAESWISESLFGEPPRLGQGQQDSGPVGGPMPAPNVGDPNHPQTSGFPPVIQGKDGWLYLGADVSLACQPDMPLDQVITQLRKLRSVVEASGRKFVLVVAPNKTTMVPENLPNTYAGATCSRQATSAFWQQAIVDGGVVDMRPVLNTAANTLKTPLYSKVDSHWTFAGALAMTYAIAEKIQPGVTSTWASTPGPVFQGAGDLPPLMGRSEKGQVLSYNLAPDGHTILSKGVDLSFTQHPLNLSEPPGPGIVTASVGMIADSFTQPATSFLGAGFENVTIAHADMVAGDPHQVGAMLATKDVVVVESAERSLVGGVNPILTDSAINAIGAELAKQPRR